jgi:hypothetical protein
LVVDMQHDVALGRAGAKAQRDVVQELACIQALGLKPERRLVQLRQVAQGLHQLGGVARVAKRHLHELPVLRAIRVAVPSTVERLQARDGRGQRRAQVVRQVTHAFAAQVVHAAQRLPLLPQSRQHRPKAPRQLPELVAPVGGRHRDCRRIRGPPVQPFAGHGRNRIAQLAQRPRDGGDDPGGQQCADAPPRQESPRARLGEGASTTAGPPGGRRLWCATSTGSRAGSSARMMRRRTGFAAMTASASMRSGSSPMT